MSAAGLVALALVGHPLGKALFPGLAPNMDMATKPKQPTAPMPCPIATAVDSWDERMRFQEIRLQIAQRVMEILQPTITADNNEPAPISKGVRQP